MFKTNFSLPKNYSIFLHLRNSKRFLEYKDCNLFIQFKNYMKNLYNTSTIHFRKSKKVLKSKEGIPLKDDHQISMLLSIM